ncbi:hypothetical protein [Algoriphagus sp. oki45]|uniref:hypothetical protein n=1 Tax=Algoriphagus sp. oki45 TaxID=3067294 RepID=UPI0030C6CE3C
MSEVLDFEPCLASSKNVQRIPGQNIWAMTSLAQPNLDSKYIFVIHSNDSSHVGQDLKSNLEKLEEFKKLEFNWNGNNAEPFSDALIEKAKSVLFSLRVQPEIFPTARKSIQFEYEKGNGDYLEIEIFEDFIKFFQVIGEIESSDKIDFSRIFYKVNEFYGEGFYQR